MVKHIKHSDDDNNLIITCGVSKFLLTLMPAKKGCRMAFVSDQGWSGLFVNFALTLHDICKQKK